MDDNGSTAMIRENLKHIADDLPEGATWDDVLAEILDRMAIEKGLEDSRAGRVTPVAEVRRKYGLPE